MKTETKPLPTMTKEEDYLTTGDLAKLFRRSPATVRYWIQQRGLARYGRRFGRDWVFTPEDVLRFLEEEMASWYAEPQWAAARRRLSRVKARLLRLCKDREEEKTHPPKRKVAAAFRSYPMGALRGSLRRVELYRERPSRG